MMNYNDFLNKQVVNKNNELGVVLSFDNEHIIVKYPNDEKTYNPDIAFKTGFLAFKNKSLKRLIDQDLLDKDIAAKKKEEELAENHRKYLARRKKVNETYKRMYAKNRMLLALFGKDFIYPPIKEFEKKYKHLIDRSTKYQTVFTGSYGYYGTPWYYWY